MPVRKPIWLICPQHLKRVRGSYECDEAGRYRLGLEGQFLLKYAACEQDGGRCIQTLCVLHRYNRRGPASWYPERILAMREPKRRKAKQPAGDDLA